MPLTVEELAKLERIEFENKLATFRDERGEWLCELIRGLHDEATELQQCPKEDE